VYGVSDGTAASTATTRWQAAQLLPTTSVEAYAATLGKWFGLSDSELLAVLPGLRNWNYSQRNLGFMLA
jgi:hypothetical protein